MNTRQNDPEYLVVTGDIKPKKVEKFEESIFEIAKGKKIKGNVSFVHTLQSNLTDIQMKEKIGKKRFSKIIFHKCSGGIVHRVCKTVKNVGKGAFMVMVPQDPHKTTPEENIRLVNKIDEAFDFVH